MIVLGDDAVAVKFLFPAHRDRTGEDDAVYAEDARRLEAIVHAEHVELEREARCVIAADHVGEVDDPARLGRPHLTDDIVELGNVAAHDAHLLAELAVIRGLGIEVHADNLLAALCEKRDQPPPDKTGAADDEDGHARLSLVRTQVRGEA
jgi:hypothetical protein